MKYTIELTDNQKGQMDLLIEMAHKHVGFTPKLEMDIPLPMKESPAYKKGFEDGTKWAIDENAKDHQGYYDNGYNNALEDLTHAMKVYFPLNGKERLDYFGLNVQVDTYATGNPKDLIAKAKAYEEKKKEEIKVGDEVTVTDSDALVGYTFIVMQIIEKRVVGIREDWRLYENLNLEYLEKTGRHFDEVPQLLDKLRGEKE